MFRFAAPDEFALEAIFNASPNAYMLLDRNLVIVGCNDSYLKAVGRASREGVVGRNVFEAFPSDPESESFRLLKASFQRVLKTEKADAIALIPYDTSQPGEAPQMRYWSATHTPVFDKSGNFQLILQHTVDVTELQRFRETSATATIAEAGVLNRARTVQIASEQIAEESERFMAAFQQAPGFVGILVGPDHVFQIVNGAYTRLVGGRRLTGLPVVEALPEVADQGFVRLLDEVRRTGKAYVGRGVQVQLRQSDGGPMEERFVDFVYQPLRDEDGQIYGIFVQGNDITEQKRAELALAEQTALLQIAQEGAGFGTFDYDLIAGTVTGSPTYRQLFGVDTEEPVSVDTVLGRIYPEDRTRATLDNIATPAEYRVLSPEGLHWVWRRGVAVRDANGRVVRVVGAVQDITQRKNIEEQLVTLARESAHRVKNTLAIAQAVVDATLRQAPDIASGRKTVTARLAALSLAQPALIEGVLAPARISPVVEAVMNLHKETFGRVQIEGADAPLAPRTAQGLALILHELATNALKYGAFSNDTGAVSIRWREIAGEKRVELEWSERGGPQVDPAAKKGFGAALIERALPPDKRNHVELVFAPTGVICRCSVASD